MAIRGIRQGDPFPFPFLLISYVLTLVENIYAKDLFEGFIVESANIHVPIFQFADGTLLLCMMIECLMH